MKLVAVLLAALLASASAQTVAPGAKKPCLEAGGVAIKLNGNFGFCYLKGRRMRPGSVFAQCSDGKIACYEDEGIPDKPRKKVDCPAPEPGFCGSDKDATPAPTTPKPANATSDASRQGVDEEGVLVGDEEEAKDENETRGAKKKPHTVNPSALVAGNLPSGEIYEDEDDEQDDGVYRVL